MRARGFWKRCLTGKKCLYVGKKEPKVEWGLHELVLAARHTTPTYKQHCFMYSWFWGSAVWSGLSWVILPLISRGGIWLQSFGSSKWRW